MSTIFPTFRMGPSRTSVWTAIADKDRRVFKLKKSEIRVLAGRAIPGHAVPTGKVTIKLTK